MFENTYQREYHGTKAYLVMDGKNKTKDEEAKNTLILGIHIHTGQMSHSNAKLFILFLRSIFVPEFCLAKFGFFALTHIRFTNEGFTCGQPNRSEQLANRHQVQS